ncbi:cytochrome P450 [Biscogniauxia marginata]|nr:cytochrome P450 [Biscogniauxia marginata]
MEMNLSPLFLGSSVVLLFILYKINTVGRRSKSMPPGPPTLPIIGNIHQIPTERSHFQFQKWAEEYGPVYSLMIGTRVMIVLSSDQAIRDLLDKRSAIYSARPDYYIGQEVLSGNNRFVHLGYDETWRTVRKLGQRLFSMKVSESYIPYQDLESRAMLLGFLNKPDQFKNHIQRYTGSLARQITFGIRCTTIDDPMLKEAFSIMEQHFRLAASRTAALLDSFPILRRLPDAILSVKRQSRKLYKKEHDMWLRLVSEAQARLTTEKAVPCFCADLARLQKETGASDDVAADFGGNLFQANSETTASILVGFVQALLIYPNVVKEAQAELDRVCGPRIPTLEDMDSLPYIRGCVKETLRWMPGALNGIPHAALRDDEYLGYTIPKGATVMYNVWAVHNDGQRHPSPRVFDPSRWAGDSQTSAEAAANADVTKRDHFAFGAGRRLCPGIYIADRSLLLATARLLWAFDFRRAKDANGNDIIPDMDDLTDSLFSLPRPFKADIIPREGKAELIMEEWDKMREFLDDNLQWRHAPEAITERLEKV